jgi:predicted methyltransferase
MFRESIMRIVTLTGSAVLLGTGFLSPDTAAAQQDSDAAAALDAAIAGEHRSEENRARDRYRHPKETLLFFGFRPDMTVVEMLPGGGGWYTEILAPALKESGKLYAAHYGMNDGGYYRRSLGSFLTKIGAAPEVYGDVTVTTLAIPHELEVAPRGTADLVMTFRNVHNWYSSDAPYDTVTLGFKAMYDALKPGGVLGVVDHRWPDPETAEANIDSGYVSPERTIEIAESVGFRYVDSSDVNRNPKDTHDHPSGVWTLPPALRLGDEDRDKYLQIGESDRFTIKFVKPETENAG